MSNQKDGLVLQVSDVRAEACGVLLLELRDPQGAPLPAFEPGAHLEIRLPGGLVRHYSISNDCRERDRYVIGVGLSPASRGGSAFVHRSLRCGDRLETSAPRNHFRLDPDLDSYLFVAGGIGITPIMSMVQWCIAHQRPWRLVYAARSPQRAAFYDTLGQHGAAVRFHFDALCGGAALDVREALADVREGEHVYCCGPSALMDAVRTQGAHLPPERLHFEYFSAPAPGAEAAGPGGAFEVELRRRGLRLQVPQNQSILDVLEAHGIGVPCSCREGLCRTCETTVLEGEIEHHDYVLSQEERDAGRSMVICVSRARSPRLVLDL
ncbi:PDR/VanB family oxidoreductase [Hydrogenophaga sp. PML113]|uniref:PDR/VanB family oxidoreductase n=1 Tax=Hydrogenophaga sp. PML113 TaxID=1899350 RepID=UPI0008786FAA|nr:PDR/VanB family oxidoreductase [Hydrogenophaga sp. PML113]